MPRTYRHLVLVALLTAACRPAVETEPPVAPEPEPAPEPAPEPEPEPEPDPEPEPEPAPTIPDQETLSIKLGESATSAGGIALRFVGRNHKHAVSGAADGIWTLELAHEGNTEQLEVRGRRLHVEHAFAGQLLVITEPEHGALQVDLRTNPKPAATPEEARAQLVEMLAERGVAMDGGALSHSQAHGVLSLSVMRGKDVIATAEIGLHTRELLSLRRPLAAAFRPRRGKPLEKFRLNPGRSKTTSSGAVVRWARQSHKHRVGGGAVGIWAFTVKKDGETKSVGVTDESLYAELAAFDQVFTFRDDDDGRVLVRVYAKKRGRLGENRAFAKVEALGEKLGLDPDGSAISQEAGAYEVLLRKKNRDLIWVKVGVHTHRITDYVLRDRIPRGRKHPSPID